MPELIQRSKRIPYLFAALAAASTCRLGGCSETPESRTSAAASVASAKYKTEVAACASKRPESVTDREKRKDPGGYQDDLRQQVKCMKSRGLDIVAIPPNGWGVTDEAAARGYVPDFRVV